MKVVLAIVGCLVLSSLLPSCRRDDRQHSATATVLVKYRRTGPPEPKEMERWVSDNRDFARPLVGDEGQTLVIDARKGSRLVDVTVTGADQARIADACNQVVQAIIQRPENGQRVDIVKLPIDPLERK